jgi:hypothetical protein
MTKWYVVARDPDYINVFGPFLSEIDARAYAMDLADDNGWDSVVPMTMEHEDAEDMATSEVLWPYSEAEEGESGEED